MHNLHKHKTLIVHKNKSQRELTLLLKSVLNNVSEVDVKKKWLEDKFDVIG